MTFVAPDLTGVTIGRYRVGPLIARGGMGAVHHAYDSVVGRDVALKILPIEYASDEARTARLRHEGQVLASLNHPHIATLHDVVETRGLIVLVLELVEGETLSERLLRGPFPLEEALQIATEIADALSAAHERGIVHGDLKPANVRRRPDGHVKVIDFGLADEMSRSPEYDHAVAAASTLDVVGRIQGTPAYLSPERLDGAPPSIQADLWAYGCLLFELLTGVRAFDGASTEDVFARIRFGEVAWYRLPSDTPPLLVSIIRRCLQREPHHRLSSMADVGVWLHEAVASAPGRRARPTPAVPALLGVAGVIALMVLSAWGLRFRPGASLPRPPMRQLLVPTSTHVDDVAISPDGQKVAYAAESRVWVVDLADPQPRALTDIIDRPQNVFWSPDSRTIGFSTPTSLLTVNLQGVRHELCRLPDRAIVLGADWSAAGTIIFSVNDGPLYQVSAAGGVPAIRLAGASTGHIDFHSPSFLPDGKRVLTVAHARDESYSVAIIDGEGLTPVYRPEATGLDVARYADGHLLLARPNRVGLADVSVLPFDLATMRPTGEERPLAANVTVPTASRDGAVAVMKTETPVRQLAWVTRAGHLIGTVGPPLVGIGEPTIRADGGAIAFVTVVDGSPEIWAEEGGVSRRLAGDRGATTPRLLADGRLLFRRLRADGADEIVVRKADWDEQAFMLGRVMHLALDGNGTGIWYSVQTAKEDWDIFRFDTSTGEPPVPVVTSPGDDTFPSPSPDGRFVAYVSRAGGGKHAYVKPAIVSAAARRVADNVDWVLWRGNELFFGRVDTLLSATIQTSPSVSVGPLRPLFNAADAGARWLQVDVTPSGDRILLVRTPYEFERRVVLIENWQEGAE